MAGFILTSDPRNHYQNHVIVGGGNFIQQGPYGMGMPTPYGMVNPRGYGMVIPAPCVQMVTRRHPNNYRPQNNSTDYSDTYSRNPCLEELPDNTGIGKVYSSTRLFKALQYTNISGETSQTILDAVNKSWCISDTQVNLIFYGNEQPKRETTISTRGGNRLIIHVHENGFWNLEWERKKFPEAIGKEYSRGHLFRGLQYTQIPGETSQAILEAVNQSWCISDTQVNLIFYGKNQPKQQIKISENGSNILNIHVHENGFWELEWVKKTCTKECIDGLSRIKSVFPFDYISGGYNLLSFLFTSKK